jgi:ABC-type enterochelin transport system permease subunit
MGAVLIGTILVVAAIQASWVVLLPLVAVPIVISAIIGWDTIYVLFHKLPTPCLISSKARPVAEINPQDAISPQVESEVA